ncbi:MAG: 4Fe-4S dicluster domain-containing protein [Rhodospirillaceae bacterium]
MDDLPDRREFLKVMAASLAMAGMAGCGDGPREAVPYVQQPEDVVPGQPRWFATATMLGGYAQPTVAEVHEGRPTKLDGTTLHPASRGGSDVFLQAAVLGVYDPDRSATALRGGVPVATEAALAALGGLPPPLVLLTGAVTSPSLARQIEAVMQARPDARWHVHEPALAAPATELSFGRTLDVHWHLDRAPVLVSIGADLLGPGPHQVLHTAQWANSPRLALFVAEATPSLTGARATARLAVSEHRLPALVLGIGAAFGVAEEGALSEGERAWVDRVVRALRRHGGVVAVSPTLSPEIQAVGFAINGALGSAGVRYSEPVAFQAQGSLADVSEIGSLVVLDCNPVYTAPAFAAVLKDVPVSVHAGVYADETAALCTWHLPLAHDLERWGDGQAVDGTAVLQQPLIPPLTGGVNPLEIVAALRGARIDPLAEVRATWSMLDDTAWRRALHDGLVEGTAAPPLDVSPRLVPAAAPEPSEGLEVVFRPDPTVWDGRFANNAWLQELPTPLEKISWDAVALIAPTLAERLGVAGGDTIAVTAGGKTIEAPAWVVAGQAAQTVTLFLGHGRTRAGRVGTGVGYDAYALRPGLEWCVGGAEVAARPGTRRIARTQLHHDPGPGVLVPVVAAGEAMPQPKVPRPSLYPPWKYKGHAWGMVIDTDLCTGCNACVVACQAENSVPVVGREEVLIGREMYWLRVDSYHAEDGQTRFLPVACMHCEKAPCEVGCPVNATVHGPEGLNQMVYNRCIGTRTCSSYCPYKVRRFNYFSYAAEEEGRAPQRNPDVTVRGRGVMEKCTYCVQRINAARIQAELEDRAIRDGEITTACQDACPARAITFGDLSDSASAVSRGRADPRNYRLLDELNTWPRTSYLAAVRAEDV